MTFVAQISQWYRVHINAEWVIGDKAKSDLFFLQTTLFLPRLYSNWRTKFAVYMPLPFHRVMHTTYLTNTNACNRSNFGLNGLTNTKSISLHANRTLCYTEVDSQIRGSNFQELEFNPRQAIKVTTCDTFKRVCHASLECAGSVRNRSPRKISTIAKRRWRCKKSLIS